MEPSTDHRKLVRHFNDPRHIHELTFSCYRRWPLLADEQWRSMLAESIDRAMERHGYRLTAFVFMPEHVHLLVFPLPGATGVDSVLRAIKRPFSYRVKQRLLESQSPLLDRLTIRQRPGVMTFRYWQEGPGYDRNLTSVKSAVAAIDYIHLNPVRRALAVTAADWKWSSADYYLESGRKRHPDLPRIHPLPADWLSS
jgi:putative transposase